MVCNVDNECYAKQRVLNAYELVMYSSYQETCFSFSGLIAVASLISVSFGIVC